MQSNLSISSLTSVIGHKAYIILHDVDILSTCSLQGLTGNSRDGRPVKVGQTEDELWRQFDIHRAGVVGDILDQKTPMAYACLTKEQSYRIREIVDV